MLIMKYMHRIGVKLIELHKFWYIYIFLRLNRKTEEDMVDVGVKSIFQCNSERRIF